ncbi:sucrose phosphorylase [Halanaerobium saccharolyticum]|uniref:Sucrose 6(F)-phosphate phosphorylase n=1 Tax=Halanaerobium saccharolyticum TaxID=43595 RepID=A0A4R7Z0B9_9FIRM|nr:sucrose phosphorylase [Halanaerobium saccharolyticum]RAK08459.1 sucrose phosphorylase [Halanaerobium saccharolyticum]TDW03506.1 sucrose phosphorylase [Halanaerobium saccharolyticum]TDX59951.1 sucrose phosphorylase [Halanaerobium saccharolyticum]
MTVENKIMLITYADSMGQNLKDLKEVLDTHFKKAVGGVHILPFYPSSADRGFAPLTYREVDPKFGDWGDLEALKENYYLMFDFMVNHISKQSEYFKDFQQHKDDSKYSDFFIRYQDFWDDGEPTEAEVDLIYKRKPRAPYIEVEFEDGIAEKIWCTFDEEQLDLNMESEVVKEFIKENLKFLAAKGASIIRLDAFAYAIKKAGSSCFFIEPDIWKLLDYCKEILAEKDVEILAEIHEHYSIQLKIAEKGHPVYDFSLPMLLLHSIYSSNSKRLRDWLKKCPDNQYTTLDTHDGIGVVDVKDLMTDQEIEATREMLYKQGSNVKKIYSSEAYDNLDIYQINCSYYSALGNDDDSYLLARAVQFFAPGIPQVYYVGMLAGENDIELLEETKVGRNINRHYYSKAEIEREVKRPVVQKLIKLMEFRNYYPAFAGDYTIHDSEIEEILEISWQNGKTEAHLSADFTNNSFEIRYFDQEAEEMKTLNI